jgi:O-antigen/teichoic acid export membrane protein
VTPPSAPRTLVRQVGYLTISATVVRLCSGLLTILIARVYGPTLYGAYATALGLANLVVLVPDFGIYLLIARDGARDPARLAVLMRVGLLVKTWLSATALVLLLAIASVVHYPPLTTVLLVVTGVGTLAANYYATYYGGYLALEDNYRAAVLNASVGAFALAGAALVALAGGSIVLATFGSALGGGLAVLATALRWRAGIAQSATWAEYKQILAEATPFAIAGVLYYIYFRIDVVMLSMWRPAQEVGFYNAAYRLVAILYFVPGSICAALFSRLSRIAGTDPTTHGLYVAQMARLMSSVAVPIVATLIGTAPLVMVGLFGRDYAEAASLVTVLAWFLLFQCVSFPLGDGLSTTNRQAARTWVMGLAAVLNISLNFFWIQSRGARGAAWATLLTEGFVAVCYWFLLFTVRPQRALVLGLLPALLGGGVLFTVVALSRASHIGPLFESLVMVAVSALAVLVANRLASSLGLRVTDRTPTDARAVTTT